MLPVEYGDAFKVGAMTSLYIGVITIDNPPVNALSRAVADGIRRRVRSLASDDSVRAAVLIGAGSKFIEIGRAHV